MQPRRSPQTCCCPAIVPTVPAPFLLSTFSLRACPLLFWSTFPQLAIFRVPNTKIPSIKKRMHHSLIFEPLDTVGDSSAPVESYTTFRLQGIPSKYTKDTVKTLLREALRLDREATIQIKSLAISPYDKGEAVATLTFDKIPPTLSNASPLLKFEFTLPNTQSIAKTVDLLLDTHFYGFTTLHCPETSAWKFEYVKKSHQSKKLLTPRSVSSLFLVSQGTLSAPSKRQGRRKCGFAICYPRNSMMQEF